jgi:hypothetical protein
MVHRRLVSCVGLIACAAVIACDNAPDRVNLGGTSFPPGPPMTAPVDGVVRAVGGGPLPNVPVSAWGVANSEPSTTMSDANGHYALPSMRLQGSSGVWISSNGIPGYLSGNYPLALLAAPEQVVQHVDIHMQPRLALVDEVAFDLSNDDIAYGYDTVPGSGLPLRRWPVKLIDVSAPSSGALEFRAEWIGDAPIHIWIEHAYLDDGLESQAVPGESAATLFVPDGWMSQARGGSVTLTVGVPFSSNGIPTPVSVRLSVRQTIEPS